LLLLARFYQTETSKSEPVKRNPGISSDLHLRTERPAKESS
jgi:hypothetical protein